MTDRQLDSLPATADDRTKQTNLCASLSVRTVRPLGENVLIALELTPKTQGMIAIPDTAIRPEQWGIVLAVGPDIEEPILPGDRVFTRKHDGMHYEENGVDLLIVKASKLQAIDPLVAA